MKSFFFWNGDDDDEAKRRTRSKNGLNCETIAKRTKDRIKALKGVVARPSASSFYLNTVKCNDDASSRDDSLLLEASPFAIFNEQ